MKPLDLFVIFKKYRQGKILDDPEEAKDKVEKFISYLK